jgi:hypothetical protein
MQDLDCIMGAIANRPFREAQYSAADAFVITT